jgi:hypothetical protein
LIGLFERYFAYHISEVIHAVNMFFFC